MKRVIPLVVGLVAGLATYALALWMEGTSDFAIFHDAARALLHGQNPYAVIASTRHYPLFYPLPAIILLLPLAPLPVNLAHATFGGLGVACFALAAKRWGRGLWPALLSYAAFQALSQGQWPLFTTAAAVLPWLGFVWAAKPSTGAGMFAGFPSRTALAGGLTLTALSFAFGFWPHWWLPTLESTYHVAPLLRPGGWILLLAGVAWRRPEGRMLLALGFVPQSTVACETLPLFLIPRTRIEGYLLAILSWVGQGLTSALFPPAESPGVAEHMLAAWPILLGSAYVPALGLLLIHAWRDRAAALGAGSAGRSRISMSNSFRSLWTWRHS